MPYKSITILLLLLLLQLLSHVSAGRPMKCQTRTPYTNTTAYRAIFFTQTSLVTHIHWSLRMVFRMCAFNVLYCAVNDFALLCLNVMEIFFARACSRDFFVIHNSTDSTMYKKMYFQFMLLIIIIMIGASCFCLSLTFFSKFFRNMRTARRHAFGIFYLSP